MPSELVNKKRQRQDEAAAGIGSKALADVLTDAAVPLSALTQIAAAIPSPTVLLARACAVLTRRITQSLPDDANPGVKARWLDRLGVMLNQAGRPGDALPPTEEAVAIRRQLAVADPDRYRPDLPIALSNLGVWFSRLGRPADAVPPAQEAVALYRQLAAANPDRYRPGVATCLNNLGIWFSELNRLAEALPPTEESVVNAGYNGTEVPTWAGRRTVPARSVAAGSAGVTKCRSRDG